ncbi:MAG: exonuclease domain-containing protein [Oscillospiraceae bacterium]|nr:exonuclease domain-containing protein [Oscillospiraceae bacterium]
MVRVFIDLEMNMVSQKNTELRAALPHEIIEIGAVKLDEKCRVVDRFCCYVRPRYNSSVHWTVAKLTGITTAELKKADYIEDVMPRFVEWIGTNESVRLYAWSNSDQAQLERECTFKNLWTPALRSICSHWTDFQRVFSRMVGYRNGMSLSRAVEYMGLDFAGDKHDALSDAENCARLLALMQDEEEFARRKALVPPEPVPVKKPRPKPENEEQPEEMQKQSAENTGTAGNPAKKPDTPKKPHRRRRCSRCKKVQGDAAKASAKGGSGTHAEKM